MSSAPPPIHSRTLQSTVSVAEGARRLAEAVGTWLNEHENSVGLHLRQAIHVPVSAIEALAGVHHPERMLCALPGSKSVRLGIGVAARWSGAAGWPCTVPTWLGDGSTRGSAPLFISARFDPEHPSDDVWTDVSGIDVTAPAVTLTIREDVATLDAYVLPEPSATTDRLPQDSASQDSAADGTTCGSRTASLEALAALAAHAGSTKPWRAVLIEEQPDRDTWTKQVHALLHQFERGAMEKCVLARTRTYAVDGHVDPFTFLDRAAGNQPRGLPYGLTRGDRLAYVGVTPEVLFRRHGNALHSHALAGTRPRRAEPREDEALGRELLESAKDLAEHEYVRSFIADALKPLCNAGPSFEGPMLRKLADLQHLDTRVEGELAPETHDGALLCALHPTPAVCGVPTGEARSTLADLEAFDRGLYAGVMGWVDGNDALLVVCIRGARFGADGVTLYGGAGIVADSDADAEWLETAAKMRGLDDILRIGHDA